MSMLSNPYMPVMALIVLGIIGGMIENGVQKYVGKEHAFYYMAVWLLAGGSSVGCVVAVGEPIFWLFATSAAISYVAFALMLKDLVKKIYLTD